MSAGLLGERLRTLVGLHADAELGNGARATRTWGATPWLRPFVPPKASFTACGMTPFDLPRLSSSFGGGHMYEYTYVHTM